MHKPPIEKFLHNNWVYIPGGTNMIDSKNGYLEEKPVHKLTLSPFWICKYNITVTEFSALLNGKSPIKDFLAQFY